MIIRVLPQLNSRQQWIDFCRREMPYCFVEQPQCLIDFQSTHLQITLLSNRTQGKDAIKYSLGSRRSVEPAWQLIRACHWDLNTLLTGLEQMDFSSNVRDNSLLGVHTDLTARKFFSKERSVIAPSSVGLLKPLGQAPDIWSGEHLLRLIANGQYSDLRNEQIALPHMSDTNTSSCTQAGGIPVPSISSLRLMLLEQPWQWVGQQHNERLHLFRERQPIVSLIPDFTAPAPRLKAKGNARQNYL